MMATNMELKPQFRVEKDEAEEEPVIGFLVFWNLADYLYTTYITSGAYHFEAGNDGAIPGVVAIVSGYLLFIKKNYE